VVIERENEQRNLANRPEKGEILKAQMCSAMQTFVFKNLVKYNPNQTEKQTEKKHTIKCCGQKITF